MLVAFPQGDLSPGNGVIFAVLGRHGDRLAADRAVLDVQGHDLDVKPKTVMNVSSATTSADTAKAVATAADLQAILLDVATKLSGLGAPLDPGSITKIATPPAAPSFAAQALETR